MTDHEILEFLNRFKTAEAGVRPKLISDLINTALKEDILIPSRAIILLRHQDRLEEAEIFSSYFSHAAPFDNYVTWELGYSFGVSGDHLKAIDYIKKSIAIHDAPDRRLWLAVQLAMNRDFDAAEEALSKLDPENAELSRHSLVHREFFELLKKYDRSETLKLLANLKEKYTTKSIFELEQDILTAIQNKTPYMLLRLGDGEGAYIQLNSNDEVSNSNYYRSNREEFANIWFKDSSVLDDSEFFGAIDLFNESIRFADAIGGGMYNEAINLEYKYSSKRGIAWVVNTMRKLSILAQENPAWAKKVSIFHLVVHYDLLLSGSLRRILAGRPHIGLISCQDELPQALQRTYDIEKVDFIKVPGEQIHSSTLGGRAVAGRHWPDRYREIISALDAPLDRRGELWLVAAGILGKIYAAKLKSAGAVVLDIGAVADLWMGKMTRTFPDIPEEAKLQHESSLSQEADILTLVDVGGLGGLGDEWLPYIDCVRAVLFEPNPPEAAQAREKISASPGGIVIERALSNRAERRTLHVTKSLGCTSLFEPNYRFLKNYSIAPAFRVTHQFDVDCVRFDSIVAAGEAPIPDAIKIDVQGFEYNVLEGFGGLLSQCLGVKTESHLYPIYNGQKLLHDLVELLHRYGLSLRKIEPVRHFDGDIVEVDAWFTCSSDRINTLTTQQLRKLSFLEKVWKLDARSNSFGETQFDD